MPDQDVRAELDKWLSAEPKRVNPADAAVREALRLPRAG